MSQPPFEAIEYTDAPVEVQTVFDEIKAARSVDDVNNFWKYLANDPKTLRRTWESLREVMAPDGALDPVMKEMLYLALSMNNDCAYCTASHGKQARNLGMTDEMFKEMIAIIAMANETNRLANAYQVPID